MTIAQRRDTESSQPSPPAKRRRLEVDDCIIVDRKSLHKAQIGAGVGNFMEWYDIGVYGYLAVTMTTVFTAGMSSSMGLLVTLFGFSVSFVVRPLGGIILGPLGDKLGRRRILFLTITMMAAATALIGLLPTAESVGLWVIIPLYLLKMVQGFSTGGEFSGASTYVAEFSPDRHRGRWTSLLNTGSMVGFAAAAGVVAVTTVITTNVAGPDAMINGGWRIPFLVAIPLGIAAIMVRKIAPETPSFELNKSEEDNIDPDSPFARHGILGILKHFWPQVIIGVCLTAADSTASYALTSYMPTYLETEIGISLVGTAVTTVCVLTVVAVAIPFLAAWSDRVGRKPVYATAVVTNIVVLVPAFMILHVGEVWAVYVALGMTAIPVACYLSLTASAISELFPTSSRYGGMGLTHNLAVSVFGGTTPLVSQLLIQVTGNSYMPAFYILFFSVVAGVALLYMRETGGGRPLLGSAPTVETLEQAEELVAGQAENPHLDLERMMLPETAPAPRK